MTNDENKLNRRMDYEEALKHRKPAIAMVDLQLTYFHAGKRKHVRIPAGTPVWYLMSVDNPYIKEVQGRHKGIYSVSRMVMIENVSTEGHPIQVYADEVELVKEANLMGVNIEWTDIVKYLDYNGYLDETISDMPQKDDPCGRCKPNSITGNCPCDNGYPCEHMYVPGVR